MEQEKTDSDPTWTYAGKEPPPLGLAGLEAFRREYLTSPLSHLRNMGSCNPLLPPFPPLLPPGLGGSPAPGGGGPEFARNNPNRSSLSGGGTPPSERERGGGGGGGGHGGSAHSTPSSEFSSQQNWSFEEQFKQVSGNATFKSFWGPSWDMISLFKYIHYVLFSSYV